MKNYNSIFLFNFEGNFIKKEYLTTIKITQPNLDLT